VGGRGVNSRVRALTIGDDPFPSARPGANFTNLVDHISVSVFAPLCINSSFWLRRCVQ
jgi:hypothetical protein